MIFERKKDPQRPIAYAALSGPLLKPETTVHFYSYRRGEARNEDRTPMSCPMLLVGAEQPRITFLFLTVFEGAASSNRSEEGQD